MQLPSLTGLSNRLRDRVDNAARGSDVPAGIERGEVAAPTSSRERGQLRRRLRELRRLREAQLLELGALVLEAHKHGREEPPVVKAKAAEAAATDAEARAIGEALGNDAGLDTIIAAGIAGPCPTCGTLGSTVARFCSNCGTPLDGRTDAAARAADDAYATADPRTAGEEPARAQPAAANGDGPDEATTELAAHEQ